MTAFKFTKPRNTIEIHLPDDKVLSGPRGSTLEEIFAILADTTPAPIVGAIVNGQLRELTYRIYMDAKVTPVTMAQADGMRIYRRSLTFLLETAFHQLFPKAILEVDHSISSGGYYCQVFDRAPLEERELQLLEIKMRELVEQNQPFIKQLVPLSEAIAYFESIGQTDKVQLLAHRKKSHLVLYSLGSHKDYHHGYMVPSTGYLKWFALSKADDGFTLRFPRRHRPTEILPLPDYPKLLETFRQYGAWLQHLGIDNVGSLNNTIESNKIREAILIAEALHEQKIAEIASTIASTKDIKVVLIAGPSSSGKTTFSKRLAIQLLALGLSPFPLEMDNYFVDREKTPKDENGEYDFESINALDTEKLSKDIIKLINGEKVQLPRYDFIQGKQLKGDIVRLQPNQVIILEGIHGLNPQLIPNIPTAQSYRIYVSALTQLNLDRHNRVSTTDTRLIRRIVRDARERGYSAEETINRWESVRRGEKRYIFPYQENADTMFNSALVYELAALKPFVEPLLRQVPYGTPAHIEAKRLLSFLEWFLPISTELIPDNSILREFIGGSILKEFTLWNRMEPPEN